MNRFVLVIVGLACGAWLALLATDAAGQPAVQFPTPTQPVPSTTYPPPTYGAPAPTYSTPAPTYGAPATTYGSPAPTTSPYPATPYTPSPYAAPSAMPPPGASPYPTTPYAAPSVGPPPAFDPYASGTTFGAGPPPPSLPYNYTPPPPASSFPQQPGALYPEGSPFQWQPGQPGFPTSTEGYWATTQRLLQELSMEHTYLWGESDNPNHFALNRTELSATFAIPMFYNIETPLLVTPGFAANWLDGPIADPAAMMPREPDLPPRVYDAYLDFAWYPRWMDWIGGELGFRTGVWSDFTHVDTDSIRLMGRGLASVSITPQFDILFGVVYLDRLSTKLLPAGGFYFRPTPEWDLYVVFPNPKVRKFLAAVGNTKWYGYAAGEYGGGSWKVERGTDNLKDRFDYNDIRVMGGLEWETQTLIRGHLELGYVWDRELVFRDSDTPEFNPSDTFMVRGGVAF